MAGQATTLAEQSLELLRARGLDSPSAWLAESLAGVRARGEDLGPLRVAIARAPRKLGRGPLALSLAEREHHGMPPALEAGSWRLEDLGRAALLLAALAQIPRAAQVEIVAQLVRTAELGEQASLLRAFSLLPEPARFVDIAVDACRTNAADVFAAIAVDNAYPAAEFPEHNFNQMVLKALFIGVPVTGIVGLERRASASLGRMVQAYASERRAAGRSVPEGVEHVARLCPPKP